MKRAGGSSATFLQPSDNWGKNNPPPTQAYGEWLLRRVDPVGSPRRGHHIAVQHRHPVQICLVDKKEFDTSVAVGNIKAFLMKTARPTRGRSIGTGHIVERIGSPQFGYQPLTRLARRIPISETGTLREQHGLTFPVPDILQSDRRSTGLASIMKNGRPTLIRGISRRGRRL